MRYLALLLLLALKVAGAAPVEVLLTAATDEELRPVIERLQQPATHTRAAWTFWTGTIAGRRVAIARTEGDPLNAVAATTLAIRMYQPRLVITFGTARALDPALQAGDVAVSGAFVAYDGAFTPVVPLGGGTNPLTWLRLPHALMTPGETEAPTDTFPADPEASRRLSTGVRSPVTATLGSANQVNQETDRMGWLHRNWEASTEDGESAHVAGAALLLGVPVAGLRVIDGKPGEAASVILRFLEAKR